MPRSQSRFRSTRAAGISLVEMQIVIALLAVLISLTGVCLHGIYRAHGRLEGDRERRASLDRLSLQLRTDAHAADRAALHDEDAARTLVIGGADQAEIRYTGDGGDVVRTVRRGETIVHRDTFRLPGVERVEWNVSEEGKAVVTMTIAPPEGPAQDGTAISMTIEAIVGLHR